MDISRFKRVIVAVIVLRCLCGTLQLEGQNRVVNVGPEIKPLMDVADQCLRNQGNDCIQAYKEILYFANDQKEKDYYPYLQYKLARAFYLYDQHDSAQFYLKNALDLANFHNDIGTQADILNILGASLYAQGKIDSALVYMIESADKLGENGDSIYQAYAYVNIGLTLSEANNFETALQYLKSSFEYLNDLKAEEYLMLVAANIGLTYYHVDSLDQAIQWAERSLSDFGDSFEKTAEPIAYYTLAMCYSEDPDKALPYAEKSVELVRKNNMKGGVEADALQVYASLLLHFGKAQESLELAQESIQKHLEIDNSLGLIRAYQTAARAARKLSLFQLSADYFDAYAGILDSTQNLEVKKRITELGIRYETEKKEKEIAEGKLTIARQNSRIRLFVIIGIAALLLTLSIWYFYAKNQALKMASLRQKGEIEVLKAWMMGEEQERSRISRDLHDGIASMLSAALMHVRQLSGNADDAAQVQIGKIDGILEKTHIETRRIAHNLLPITLEKSGLVAALREFTSMTSSLGGLKVIFQDEIADEITLPKTTQLMLYRIVQELVQNALKHAKATRVDIKLQQSGQNLLLSVKDNGAGLTSAPTEQQGLHTVKERLESLGGDFSFFNNPDSGLQVDVHIKHAFQN